MGNRHNAELTRDGAPPTSRIAKIHETVRRNNFVAIKERVWLLADTPGHG